MRGRAIKRDTTHACGRVTERVMMQIEVREQDDMEETIRTIKPVIKNVFQRFSLLYERFLCEHTDVTL